MIYWLALFQDGHLIWVLISFAPIHDQSGELQYFIAHIQDITERKQIEDNLRKQSRAVESSPVSIVITDNAGTIE